MYLRFTQLLFLAALSIGFFYYATPTIGANFSWQTVGGEHLSNTTVKYPATVISPNGTIYIAYKSAGTNEINVIAYNGSSWSQVGAADFSPGEVNSVSLAVSTTNTPYVAFLDVTSSSRATVMRLDGSDWTTAGNANFSTSSIEGLFIAISPSGIPYVAFIDTGNNSAVTIMKLSGSSWTTVGSPYTAAPGGSPSMVFTTTGTPYVAFSDTNTGEAKVIGFDGSQWNLIGSAIPVNLSANAPIAINSGNTLYVATADVSNTFVQVFSFNGTSWSQVGSNFTIQNNGQLSIAISSAGTPYITLPNVDTSQITVITYNGSSWSTVGSEKFTAPTMGFASIVVSQDGTPYIAYSDTDFDYRITVMGYLSLPDPPVSTALIFVAPSALSNTGAALAFTINNGTPKTTDPTVTLNLNANQATVRGYTASLDPMFTMASIYPLTASGTAMFSLPPIPGVYTVYLKYYSITGNYSSLLNQTIHYEATTSTIPTDNQTIFKRILTFGSNGSDVKALQQFLNTHEFPVATTGAGSLGHETNYYGRATVAAVKRFQQTHADVILTPSGLTKGNGVFGPATRQTVLEMSKK